MAKAKYEVGERVEMLCEHVRDGQRLTGWVPGEVIETDHRMVAVQLAAVVYSNNGWRIPDSILWCTHGSRHLRRPGDGAAHTEQEEKEA